MTIDAHQLARRFAQLGPEARRGFLERLRAGGLSFAELPIVAADRKQPLPLSFAQRALWLTWQIDPDSPAYNLPGLLHLRGALDVEALRRSLAHLVERHEILRTVFVVSGDGEPSQQPLAAAPVELPVTLADGAEPWPPERIAAWANDFARRPFRLDREAPLRVALLRTGAREHRLAVVLHHIAADGEALRIMVEDLFALYQSEAGGQASTLAPASDQIQCADYAVWQRHWMAAGEQDRQLEYWRARLGDDHPVTALPFDRPRAAVQAADEGRHRFTLSAASSARIRSAARSGRSSLYGFMSAGFLALIQRFTGQRDLRLGAPVDARDRSDARRMLANLVNLVVLRVEASPHESFAALLAATTDAVAAAQDHKELPFDVLVEALQPRREPGVHPLLQIKCTELPQLPQRLQCAGLDVGIEELSGGAAHFDLSFDFCDRPEGIEAVFSYPAALFDAATVARLAHALSCLLDHAAQAPQTAIAGLRLDVPLARLEGPTLVVEPGGILAMWRNAVLGEPARAAVVDEACSLSFAQVDALSDRLAHRLRQAGVGVEVRVGVHAQRSAAFVVGLLAVFKAGGVFVPLDPALPAERLVWQMRDSGAMLLLAASVPDWEAGVPLLPLDMSEVAAGETAAPPPPVWHAGQAAYLIYTSGSTGKPKGVVVSQGALANYVQALLDRLDLAQDVTSMAMVSTVAADLGHTVLFGALCSGRTLHMIAADRAFDPDRFAAYMHEHRVDVLKIVPGHLHALLNAERAADVLPARCLIVGGETNGATLLARIAELRPSLRVVNHYGPTETTVGILTHEAAQATPGPAGLPIGRPLANSFACVLDATLAPVPVGVAGELYLAGAGLARGYQGAPGQSAERFVPNPFSASGQRLYRTGDRVRMLDDGSLSFLGRVDDQVKVRGYRVELREIAQALLARPDIAAAEVVAREGDTGAMQLHAYVVAQEGAEIDDGEVKAVLARSLPDYMLPSTITILAALPLGPNGKVDRKALPMPELAQAKVWQAPQGAIEQTLAQIWCEVLGLEQVGREDGFFALGGDSILGLKVVARARKRDLKLQPKQLFAAPSLRELGDLLGVAVVPGAGETAHTPRITPLAPEVRRQRLPMSYAQSRQWFLWQLDPASNAYHIAGALTLTGRFDIDAARATFGQLVRRHESLRTVFESDGDGQALQTIREDGDFELSLVDLSSLSGPERDARERLEVDAINRRPFDLGTGPLLRVGVLRLEPRRHVLVVVMHHIVSDGWSMQIIVDEFVARYRALVLGEALTPAPLSLQYADYALWQRGWLDAGERERQLDYWKKQLGESQPVLQLPADHARRADGRYRVATEVATLPAELVVALQQTARARGATLFMVLLAGFQLLLQRYSGIDDIRVGVPIANRHRGETEGVVGFFVNTQVLRAQIDDRMTVATLLAQVKEAALGAQDHQDLPFEQLVEALQPERSLGVSPLFQVMFNHQRKDYDQLAHLPELDIAPYAAFERATLFEFMLDTVEWRDGSLTACFSYGSELFEAATVRSLADSYTLLLAQMAAQPDRMLGELDLLGERERERVAAWGGMRAPEPEAPTLVARIEEHARLAPGAPAVVCGEQQLSYGGLNQRANQLAQRLIALGVVPERRVGVALERGLDTVPAMLAVLKSGGVYVPLDPDYPPERLVHMLADSGIDVLISHSGVIARVPVLARAGVPLLEVDRFDAVSKAVENPDVRVHGDNLVYVLYTSGSTGRPKGITMRHRVLSELLAWQEQSLPGRLKTLMFASPCFDVSYQEMAGALTTGATLVQTTGEQRLDFALLLGAAAHHEVERIYLPFAVLQHVAEAALRHDVRLPALKQLITAGEQLKLTKEVLAWMARESQCRLVNQYGPTEAHVVSQYVVGDDAESRPPPIGRAAACASLRVLDASLRLLPSGVPGELYIGGAALARGYLNRPGLSAERFIADPFGAPGARLYRTGDLARWRADGELEYLGRSDDQIKIRGFRVELGEVEQVLLSQPEVFDAAVVARDGAGGLRLVAYVAAQSGATLDAAALRARMRKVLPDYMVPAFVVLLERLPLNANGKVDRNALPAPLDDRDCADGQYEAPQGEVEAELARIWSEVLGIGRIGRGDNFFEVGGHSLLAARMVSRVQIGMGSGLTVKEVFEYPALQDMASHIAANGRRPSALNDLVAFVDDLEDVQ